MNDARRSHAGSDDFFHKLIIPCPNIAYDFGGTITESWHVRGGYFAPYPQAISRIRELTLRFGPKNNNVVSKRSNQENEANLWHWLENYRFLEQTGLLKRNVHTCKTVAEKIPIFQQLGSNILVTNEGRDLVGLEQTQIKLVVLFNPRELPKVQHDATFLVFTVMYHSWEKIYETIMQFVPEDIPTAAKNASQPALQRPIQAAKSATV